MTFLWDGLRQAWHLIVTGGSGDDIHIWTLTWLTLKVAAVSTVVALVIGLPIGVVLGLGRFRGRRGWIVLANAGLVLPPVVVGLVLALLMFPRAPLGRFDLLFTLRGVYVAQSVLAIPIIIALTTSAVSAVPSGLVKQARAFGASRVQVGVLALHEARVGVMVATIAAVGSALSEVGAIVLVGGNIQNDDQTLASAALQEVNAGHFVNGLAIGLVLLGLILVVIAALTLLQPRYDAPRRLRSSS